MAFTARCTAFLGPREGFLPHLVLSLAPEVGVTVNFDLTMRGQQVTDNRRWRKMTPKQESSAEMGHKDTIVSILSMYSRLLNVAKGLQSVFQNFMWTDGQINRTTDRPTDRRTQNNHFTPLRACARGVKTSFGHVVQRNI